jgi:hypothetical protein
MGRDAGGEAGAVLGGAAGGFGLQVDGASRSSWHGNSYAGYQAVRLALTAKTSNSE